MLNKKKSVILVLGLVCLLSLSLVSAGWLEDFNGFMNRLFGAGEEFRPSPSEGLVSYWNFEDGVEDVQGNNGGVAMGDANISYDSVRDSFVLNLDGNGDYVEIGENFDFDLNESTISAWFYLDDENRRTPKGKYDSFEQYAIIGQAHPSWDRPFYMYLRTQIHRSLAVGSNGYARGGNIETGVWTHVAGTYSPANDFTLYINGESIKIDLRSSHGPSLVDVKIEDLRIGSMPSLSPPMYFEGMLDEIRIYNRELNRTEIRDLFNFHDDQPGPTQDPECNRVGKRTFGINVDGSSFEHVDTCYQGTPMNECSGVNCEIMQTLCRPIPGGPANTVNNLIDCSMPGKSCVEGECVDTVDKCSELSDEVKEYIEENYQTVSLSNANPRARVAIQGIEYGVELRSASDNAAMIRVEDILHGVLDTKEITEGSSRGWDFLSRLTVDLKEADESNLDFSVELVVRHDDFIFVDREGAVLHEYGPNYEDIYTIVSPEEGGAVLKAVEFDNEVSGFSGDEAAFVDVLTGDRYETVWSAEGVGVIVVKGLAYDVRLSGEPGIDDSEYEVTLSRAPADEIETFDCDWSTRVPADYILEQDFGSLLYDQDSLERGGDADVVDVLKDLFTGFVNGEKATYYFASEINDNVLVAITEFSDDISFTEFEDGFVAELLQNSPNVNLDYDPVHGPVPTGDSPQILFYSDGSSTSAVWTSSNKLIFVHLEESEWLDFPQIDQLLESYITYYPSTLVLPDDPADPSTCENLVNFVQDHDDFVRDGLAYSWNWNDTWQGTRWINGQDESYTEYSAGWSTTYKGIPYYLNYHVTVFDNGALDLGSWFEERRSHDVCVANSYWSDGTPSTGQITENKVYVCNWDVLNDAQDLNNYQHNSREVLWFNDNVLVSTSFSWGETLTDEEVLKLGQEGVIDFLDMLKDNNYNYVGWEGFDLPYPINNVLYESLGKCLSDIPLGTCSPSWSCKVEPVICPPHGQQKRICLDQSSCNLDKREETLYCSPGMCSGCYLPKWFLDKYGGSKCIPYGFRFDHQFDSFQEQYYDEDYETISVEEFNRAFDDGDFMRAEVTGDNALTLWVNEEALRDEAVEYSVTISPDEVDGDYDVYYLSQEDAADIIIREWEGADEETFSIAVNEISYNAENPGQSTVEVIFGATRTRTVPVTMDAYCDVTGLVRQQKGDGDNCQNGYECESGECSYGECEAGAGKQFEALKRFFCRIFSVLPGITYESCMGGTSSGASGGGGGGSSSSGSYTSVLIERDFGDISYYSSREMGDCELTEELDLPTSICGPDDNTYSARYEGNGVDGVEMVVEMHDEEFDVASVEEEILGFLRGELVVEEGFTYEADDVDGDKVHFYYFEDSGGLLDYYLFWISDGNIVLMLIDDWDNGVLDEDDMSELLWAYLDRYPSSLEGPSSGGASISGEAIRLDTASTKIYLGDKLNKVRSVLTDAELPQLLERGDLHGNVFAEYVQTITLGDAGEFVYAQVPTTSYDEGYAFAFSTTTSDPLYSSEITFSRTVDFTSAASKGEKIELFGREYYVGFEPDPTKFSLVEGSRLVLDSSDSIAEVTAGGENFKVELLSASDVSVDVQVTNRNTGISKGNEIREGSSRFINGLRIGVISADESNLNVVARLLVYDPEKRFIFRENDWVKQGESETSIKGTLVNVGGNVRSMTGFKVHVAAPTSDRDAIREDEKFVDPVFGSFGIYLEGVSEDGSGNKYADVYLNSYASVF